MDNNGIHLEVEFRRLEDYALLRFCKSNAFRPRKKVVRYSSDFIRKQNFGFYNTQLLNMTNMIRNNYSKILTKDHQKLTISKSENEFIPNYTKIIYIIRLMILINLVVFLCLLLFRSRIANRKIDPQDELVYKSQTLAVTNDIQSTNDQILICQKDVWFNIGGKLFNISLGHLLNYPNSILLKNSVNNEKEIWFPRDPTIFELIQRYIVFDSIELNELDEKTTTDLLLEANYFNLTSIVENFNNL